MYIHERKGRRLLKYSCTINLHYKESFVAYVLLEIEDEMCKKFFEKNCFMLVLVPVS